MERERSGDLPIHKEQDGTPEQTIDGSFLLIGDPIILGENAAAIREEALMSIAVFNQNNKLRIENFGLSVTGRP